MSGLDFAARAKAIEARLIAESVSGTAVAARTAATQAEGKAEEARTAANRASAALETSRKDIDAASAVAKTAGDAAEAARAIAAQADGKADGAKAAADQASAALEASRKDIDAANAAARTAGEAAEVAGKAAEAAERIAREAAASAPRLFADLAASGLPAGISRVESSGHVADGHGAASYISDKAATAELAMAHPLACFAGKDNRYFRLLPDAQGYITPEQLGCPPYSPGNNQQPYVQAALNYVHAMRKHGVRGVAFNQTEYEIWATFRNPDVGHNTYMPWVKFEESGMPLIVRSRTGMKAAPTGTTFHRRTWQGKDPAVWANTQILNSGTWWRGGMFLLASVVGRSRLADYDELSGMDMTGHWRIMGGIPMSDNPGWHFPDGMDRPARLLDGGEGWDETDKAFWWQNDTHTGDLTFEHLEVDGFRGELFYQGGQGHGSIIGRRLICSNTDGDGFNPDPHYCSDGTLGRLDIDHLTIHHTFQGLEGGTGYSDARVGTLEMYDNVRCGNLLGGPHGPKIAPGKYVHPKDHQVSPPAYLPYDPSWDIGRVIVTNSDRFEIITCTTVGEIIAKDTHIGVSMYYAGGHNISIGRIVLITDKKPTSFWIAGVSTQDQFPPTNIHVGEVVHQRTQTAIDNNRWTNEPFNFGGKLYGPNVRVGRLSGAYQTSTRVSGDVPEGTSWMPSLEEMRGGHPDWTVGHNHDLASQALPNFLPSCSLNLYSSTPGHKFARLPDCFNRYNVGHRLKLKVGSSSDLVSIEQQNTRLTRPFLITPNTQVEFVCDGYAWVCLSPENKYSRQLPVTIAKGGGEVPPGGWSDEVEIAVPNVVSGMVCGITPPEPWARSLIMHITVADGKIFVRAHNTHSTDPVPARTTDASFHFRWA